MDNAHLNVSQFDFPFERYFMLPSITLYSIALHSSTCTVILVEILLADLLPTLPQVHIVYTSASVLLLPENGAQGLHVRISNILDTVRSVTFK
jgi:hypothetical protein